MNKEALVIKKVGKTKKTFSMLEKGGRETGIQVHGRYKIDTNKLSIWNAAEALAASHQKDSSGTANLLSWAAFVLGALAFLLCIAANSLWGIPAMLIAIIGFMGVFITPMGGSMAKKKEKFIESISVPVSDLSGARSALMQSDEVIIICGSNKRMRLKCSTYEKFAETIVQDIGE